MDDTPRSSMQSHIFRLLPLIIFISSSPGFFRVARCPSFRGTILHWEGTSHLLWKIFLFTALPWTVGCSELPASVRLLERG